MLITTIADIPATLREQARHVCASRPCALLTDVDGTIAPIAPTPEAARVMPEVPDLLARARERFAAVGVVSGRDLASLWRMLPQPGLLYVGDHGNQVWTAGNDASAAPGDPPLDQAVAEVLAAFAARRIAQTPGLRLEPKGATAAIHYRNVADPEAMRHAILAELAALARDVPARIAEGKLVVEVQAQGASNKGDAITRRAQAQGWRGIIYLGDDRTDLDAFAALRNLRDAGACATLAVAVLAPDAPPELLARADLALASIDLVPAFLAWLLALAQE